jgi:hypothetical protein
MPSWDVRGSQAFEEYAIHFEPRRSTASGPNRLARQIRDWVRRRRPRRAERNTQPALAGRVAEPCLGPLSALVGASS